MRIVGGNAKGRRLKVSKKGTRPTKGVVREAIFNIISPFVRDSLVLDVFAGSGALGIEALSRGARHCIFIEKKTRVLRDNIVRLSMNKNTHIIRADFRSGLSHVKDRQFGIIFLDPPYRKHYVEKTIAIVAKQQLLSEGGVIVAEHAPEESFTVPQDYAIYRTKRYGDTCVTMLVRT
jgi:16S rRNA (guanine(966)-N(2))-methyltransferase RsmD